VTPRPPRALTFPYRFPRRASSASGISATANPPANLLTFCASRVVIKILRYGSAEVRESPSFDNSTVTSGRTPSGMPPVREAPTGVQKGVLPACIWEIVRQRRKHPIHPRRCRPWKRSIVSHARDVRVWNQFNRRRGTKTETTRGYIPPRRKSRPPGRPTRVLNSLQVSMETIRGKNRMTLASLRYPGLPLTMAVLVD